MTKRIFNLRNVTMIVCLAIMTMFSGCNKEIPIDNPNNPDIPGMIMKDIPLEGRVSDQSGNPLSGVRVTTGSVNVTTNSSGEFSFSKAGFVDNRAIIKFEKSGYFSLVRSGEKADELYIAAVLIPKGNTANSLQTTFDAAAGAALQIAGAKVVIPSSGIMKKDGSAYSGTVKVDMRYLDPYTKNFSAMMAGGNHAGINKSGEEVILLSVGIIGVELTDNQNNPLQLKSGTPADVTWPVPAGMSGTLPTTVPVSTFDEQKGIWVEETVATLQGGVYVGQVTHFSEEDLAPLDNRAETQILKGRVIDCDGQPIAGAGVFVDASWNSDELEKASPLEFILRTDSKGEWSVRVPKDRGICMLAAWTNFANDDDYTEKYTIEGDDGIYVSKLCNEGEGFFQCNHMMVELSSRSAAYIPSPAMSYLSFEAQKGSLGIIIRCDFPVGNSFPEGKFPVEYWVGQLPNNLTLGNFDLQGNTLPATLEIKKTDTDRYEFDFNGSATLFEETGPHLTPYGCRLYYKSGKYKGAGLNF